MRVPAEITRQHLGAGSGGPWLLEVDNPPGEIGSTVAWTFPRRTAAMSFARLLRAQNRGASLDLTIRKRR